MTDLNNGLGTALKALRKSRGMTQGQVAALAGIERTSITNIEAGRQMLRVSTMNAICNALGYEVHVKFVPIKTPNLELTGRPGSKDDDEASNRSLPGLSG